MFSVPPPEMRCNNALTFPGMQPCFIRSDEISPAKKLAPLFSKTYANQLRFTPQHGWLCRDGDIWRPDQRAAMQFARQFCHEAPRQTRSPMLTAELLIETMLRLAELEPGMREALPEGEILGRAWL